MAELSACVSPQGFILRSDTQKGASMRSQVLGAGLVEACFLRMLLHTGHAYLDWRA